MFLSTRPQLLITLAFLTLLSTTSQHPPPSCTQLFSGHKTYTNCKKLPTLGAEFGWKWTTKNHNNSNTNQLDLYFGAKLETGWMAWGVNPGKRPEMVGTRALIGIRYQNGSSNVETYNITGYTKLGCQLLPSEIDVVVRNKSSEYDGRSGYFKMYATLVLNESVYNVSRLNHVWQVGYGYAGSEPMMHDTSLQNCDSIETLDLKTGRSVSIGRHRTHLRMVHGMLNIVGWGTLLPIGAIVARYCRTFPIKFKFWFRYHIFCQTCGYVLGTSGWLIGLWLGNASKDYTFQIHKILAIFIFTFTTTQMIALRLKPKPSDEYRKYWNMYHHFLGYALLTLIFVNIFQGIAILKPHHLWKWAYIAVLALLSCITIFLEIFTWTKFWLSNISK